MPERHFPVLWQCSPEETKQLKALDCPKTVPWSLVAPHETQALANHYQSLERLASRGGLSPAELVAVLDGHPGSWVYRVTDVGQAPRLVQLVMEHAAMRYRNSGFLEAADCAEQIAAASRDGRRRRYWYDFKGSAELVSHEIRLAFLRGDHS